MKDDRGGKKKGRAGRAESSLQIILDEDED